MLVTYCFYCLISVSYAEDEIFNSFSWLETLAT